MIRISLAAEHSLHCTQVQTEVKLIDQCSLIQQADYKIRRLKDALKKMSKDASLLNQMPKNPYYIKMLLTYVEDLLKIVDFTKAEILKCREVIYNISSLVKDFKGTSHIYGYIERVLVVAREKYGQLLKYYKEIAVKGSNDLTKDELKTMVQEKAERLRKSLNSVTEMRLSASTERKSQRYSPYQIRTPQGKIDDIGSEISLHNE